MSRPTLHTRADRHSHLLDHADFLGQNSFRQAVLRDAVGEHAARHRLGFIHRDIVAQARQIIGAGQAGRPGADDPH